jgi:sec-independent protein translocase protein TatA
MGALQPGHLLVILLVVLIIFGPGKMAGIGSQLGRGIREFRESTEGKDEPKELASATRYCAQCGTAASVDTSFCGQCGRALTGAA